MALLQAFDKVSVYIDKKGGRDKFFRVTQYLIKLIVQIKTINSPEKKKQYGIALVSKISKELSRARRAMRFGDVFGNIVDIRDAYRATYKSSGERYLNIVESWILMLCDFYDSLTWVYSMLDMNVDLVDYFSNVYWFLGLLIGLYKLTREMLRNQLLLAESQLKVRYDNLYAANVTDEDRKRLLADNAALKKRQKIVKLSLVKFTADTIHAADGLEIGLKNPYYTTFVMVCALTASVTGAYINWIK